MGWPGTGNERRANSGVHKLSGSGEKTTERVEREIVPWRDTRLANEKLEFTLTTSRFCDGGVVGFSRLL